MEKSLHLMKCHSCNHEWNAPAGKSAEEATQKCPSCSSTDIHKAGIKGSRGGHSASEKGNVMR